MAHDGRNVHRRQPGGLAQHARIARVILEPALADPQRADKRGCDHADLDPALFGLTDARRWQPFAR